MWEHRSSTNFPLLVLERCFYSVEGSGAPMTQIPTAPNKLLIGPSSMVKEVNMQASGSSRHPTSGSTLLIFSHLEVRNSLVIYAVVPSAVSSEGPCGRSEKSAGRAQYH